MCVCQSEFTVANILCLVFALFSLFLCLVLKGFIKSVWFLYSFYSWYKTLFRQYYSFCIVVSKPRPVSIQSGLGFVQDIFQNYPFTHALHDRRMSIVFLKITEGWYLHAEEAKGQHHHESLSWAGKEWAWQDQGAGNTCKTLTTYEFFTTRLSIQTHRNSILLAAHSAFCLI